MRIPAQTTIIQAAAPSAAIRPLFLCTSLPDQLIGEKSEYMIIRSVGNRWFAGAYFTQSRAWVRMLESMRIAVRHDRRASAGNFRSWVVLWVAREPFPLKKKLQSHLNLARIVGLAADDAEIRGA